MNTTPWPIAAFCLVVLLAASDSFWPSGSRRWRISVVIIAALIIAYLTDLIVEVTIAMIATYLSYLILVRKTAWITSERERRQG